MRIARLLFLLCLLIALCTCARAQCPSGNISITSDAEAMDYEANFGDCESLPGDLNLDGPITYTEAFKKLREVGGDLTMVSTQFKKLNDFAALERVGEDFVIKGTALEGQIADDLLALQEVGSLQIDNNPLLEALGALENLQNIDDGLLLTSNARLSDIRGLGNSGMSGQLRIRNNPSLASCAVSPICNKLAAEMDNPVEIDVSGNGADCDNRFAVQADCLGGALCPPDIYVFDNPDVLDYAAAFPNCVNLPGNLVVVGTVSNADGLNLIRSVGEGVLINCNVPNTNFMGAGTIGGDLTIVNVPSGPELTTGPYNIVSIGGSLNVQNCPNITGLATFRFLQQAGGLALINLPGLNDLSGFTRLELDESLRISNADQLESLNSMTGVNVDGKTFTSLQLDGNALLDDISYLEDLAGITSSLNLLNNPSLSECSIAPVCAAISASTANVNIGGNADDCASFTQVRDICFPDLPALLALYNATGGPNWTEQTGWADAALGNGSFDPCDGWFGVGCENGRVTSLDLNVGISGNNLTGELPQAFFRLPRLKDLDLGFNNLSGQLSGDVGLLTALEGLSLSANDFSNRIPGGIGLLTNLRSLRLNSNSFSQEIPPGIGNLTNLNLLWLNSNDLSGPVPLGITDLPLRDLRLSNNELSGALPRIGSSTLTRYAADVNSFSGNIPADLFPASATPSQVILSFNDLDGPLPDVLSNVTATLLLRNNALSGCYPASYASLCGISTNFNGNAGLPDMGSNGFFANEFCANNDACGSLPVTWLSLSATPVGKTVELAWATAAEENNAGFTVERSAGGTDWTPVSTLMPDTYAFTDELPLAGTAYYRVRQTDYDGAFSFSPVARVNFAAATASAYPNPFSNQLTLFADRPELIQLIDQRGRVVQTVQHGGAGAQVQSLGLKSGVYVLRYLGSGRTERVVAR